MSGSPRAYDVAILGAGVMGASLAYWLTRLQSGLSVLLIDQDFGFQRASSSLSASSIRQQFSCPVNVQLSSFGISFLRQAGDLLATSGQIPDFGLHEGGYLYLAQEHQEDALRRLYEVQRGQGADLALLDKTALHARFPWLYSEDLAVGCLGLSGEGWFDGPALHQAFLAKAVAQGAQRLQAKVVGLSGPRAPNGDLLRCDTVIVDGPSCESIAAGVVVNAAGPWSAALARLAGLSIPIAARRRTVFVVSTPQPFSNCPLVIDPSGFWIRPEGNFFLTGTTPVEDKDDLPLVPAFEELDENQWARLAHRIPALEAMRIERAWAGYYEMNLFDHNALLGPHPQLPGFYCMAGFSGHGMQHAAGAGLGLAEWILYGEPRSLDLRPLSVDRWVQGVPLNEANVIG
nr:FAD-dependent catabolic D-arginine dehydrogenase DauA [Cupriavidus sp.]